MLPMSTAAHQDKLPFLSPAVSPPKVDELGKTERLIAEPGCQIQSGQVDHPDLATQVTWLLWQLAASLNEDGSWLS